ncbi:MAG: hypothetical protein WAU92_04295, partial [Candidatus Sulfotelmatobacter sp.]
MVRTLDPQLRRALAERVRYCHEMGIYDFYRREPLLSESTEIDSAAAEVVAASASLSQSEVREEMAARKSAVVPIITEENIFEICSPKPECGV